MWACVCRFALFHFAALAPFFVLGPLIAEEELGGASAFATITAFGGVGSVIGSLAAIKFRPDRQLVAAFLSLLIWTPVLVAYAVAAPVWTISALALVAAAGMNFAGTLWFTALQQHVPARAVPRQLVRLGRLGALHARIHPRRAARRPVRRRGCALRCGCLDGRLERRDPRDPSVRNLRRRDAQPETSRSIP